MTAKEAYDKFVEKYSVLVVLSCYEFRSRFVFQATPPRYVKTDKVNEVFDSLYSVEKKTGLITCFIPTDISDNEYRDYRKVPPEEYSDKKR